MSQFRAAISGLKRFRGHILRNVSTPYKDVFKKGFPAETSSSYKDDNHKYGSSSYQYPNALPILGLVCCAAYVNLQLDSAHNCGIVGVVGAEDASGFLLEGLTILRNRGYDSAGIASISPDSDLLVTKYASRDTTSDSIDLVRANSASHRGHGIGIAHTRWATHGGKTDENAHPHFDSKHRVAVVHNGTINNSYDLKKELQGQGIKFVSETDTEVIAQLIGIYLDKGYDTKTAVEHALLR